MQVSDGKEDFKLFGPVNRMWCGRFDRAMTLYLSCLDSFSRYARNKDVRYCPTLHSTLVPFLHLQGYAHSAAAPWQTAVHKRSFVFILRRAYQ